MSDICVMCKQPFTEEESANWQAAQVAILPNSTVAARWHSKCVMLYAPKHTALVNTIHNLPDDARISICRPGAETICDAKELKEIIR